MAIQCQCGHREESHLPQHRGGCNLCRCPQFTPIPTTKESPSDPAGQAAVEIKPYDTGLLNDFGGGNVGWWFGYIRDLLTDAHAHYRAIHAEALDRLTAELAQAREALESHCKDWADDDEAIKKLAAPFGIDIDGNGYFVNVVEVVEQMAKKLAESELARERMRFALDRIAHHVPIMASTGDYRSGQVAILEGITAIAKDALTTGDQPSGTLEKVRSAISSARFNLVGDNNSLPIEVVSLLHNQRNAVIHIDEALALIGEPKERNEP